MKTKASQSKKCMHFLVLGGARERVIFTRKDAATDLDGFWAIFHLPMP